MGSKILVIDDEKILCKGIKRLLEIEGYAVGFALNGTEAMDLVVKNVYDLMMVDLVLPDIPGGDLCKKIIAINPAIKIIMMSGHYGLLEELELRNKCLGMSIQYIKKPFENDNMLEVISNALKNNS